MVSSLVTLLNERLEEDSSALALTYEGTGWSWAELAGLVRAFAHAVGEAGVRAQERIVLLGKNSPACFIALLGSGLARTIYVPLNWRLSPAEMGTLLDDAAPRLVVVDAEFADVVNGWNRRRGSRATVVISESLWTAQVDPVIEPSTVVSDPRDIAFQMYTSGTTGEPKGAMFENGTNVTTLVEKVAEAWGFRADDISLVCMPMFHMGGLAWALAGMAAGVRTVVLSDFDPVGVIDLCERERVTTVFFVPVMINAILASDALEQRDLALRRLTYSGAPIAPSDLETAMKLLDCDFAQIYGLTEATGAFAQLDPADHDPGGPLQHLLLSAGRGYSWVEVKIVDSATGDEVLLGESGEIWTRSDQNLVGYFNKPDETSRALTEDGWLRTGDIGCMDGDGYLFLRDRAKDMIISGGENVYPAEVEKVLASYPPIQEAAVIGVPSSKWGETVKAIVVARPGVQVDPDDLIAFTRQHLASFKCPTSVDVVRELPRTATGKIRKNIIREPYWAGRDRLIG
ncbi:MAG: Long-chain-fatty-acid--CoA ligase FadD13 [Aeromicrobium sp.]|nr:Long-chain-fatty-acid--CoA ligase FadD13 [Aeromicrobium sp.]